MPGMVGIVLMSWTDTVDNGIWHTMSTSYYYYYD